METKIDLYLIIYFSVFILFFIGIVSLFVQYRYKQKLAYRESQLVIKIHEQELISTKLEIQQLTMQEIGREIHDSVGQKLTLASLYAQQLSYQNQAPAINHKIENIGQIINESLQELRSLSKSLTGTGQAQVGNLKALLEAECNRINHAGLCHAEVVSDEETINVPQPNCNVLLRILQEFLQNSLKHADCSHVKISIQQKSGKTSVMASDNGLGFDMTETDGRTEKGIGLHNMKRRAQLVGANLELTSELGKGTTLKMDWQATPNFKP